MPKVKSKETLKTCFLITPIGSKDDETRQRVDQWMKCIYKPAIGEKYKIIRADEYQVPGSITEQIVQLIIDADLVIIDFTGLNSNVMYEAAIRHLAEKPFIQINQHGEKLPFDIQNLRSINYDPKDLNYPKQLINDIKTNLSSIENSKYEQPSLIKEKFDFNKIISDPEKFVLLLKKHIVHPGNYVNVSDNIVEINDGYLVSAANFNFGSTKIICPKCGTIQYKGYEYDPVSINFAGAKHYKCNVCGTEFEPK